MHDIIAVNRDDAVVAVGQGRLGGDLPAEEIGEHRAPHADLRRGPEARRERLPAMGGDPEGLELEDEVAEREVPVEAVGLPEGVVVEHQVGGLVEELDDAVNHKAQQEIHGLLYR